MSKQIQDFTIRNDIRIHLAANGFETSSANVEFIYKLHVWEPQERHIPTLITMFSVGLTKTILKPASL
jgi:hypothetical protein